MTALHLQTTIEPHGPAGAILLSDDQVAQLGGGKRAAVVVTVGGRSARLRLAVMGGNNLIGLSKANRALLGVELGAQVQATISLDELPRTVEVPADLAAALAAEPALRAHFDGLAFTHRREYVEWVAGAKRADTRRRRIAGTLVKLRESLAR